MTTKSSMIRMSIKLWFLCGILSVATLPIGAIGMEDRDADGIVTVDGITWKYLGGGAGGVVELSGGWKWNNNGGCTFKTTIPTSTTGAITIPSKLGGCPVYSLSCHSVYHVDKTVLFRSKIFVHVQKSRLVK